MKLYHKIFLSVTAAIMFLAPVYSQPFQKIYDQDEQINVTVYEKVNPTIVSIDAQVGDGISSGTGCIVDNKGLILTSSHVVEGATDIEITTAKGQVFKAEVIPLDIKNSDDLALLRIKTKDRLPAIALGDSSSIKVGQKVLAIGNPFGFNGTLTTGIISRIDYERNKIQTDAAINPGSSGGPILNASGEVIGISQSIFNPDNNKSNIGIGFAIPVNDAKTLLSQYNVKKLLK